MDTTLATFEQDVIAASTLAPVLVDFWVPWCDPCKSLGPMLEKLEAEAAGKWKLVKVNVDENQELAAHFQVRSIPHVMAFADGRPVDQFVGVLPEGQLREFIDQLVPQGADASRLEAQTALAEGRRYDAYDALQAALAYDPGFDEARKRAWTASKCCWKTTVSTKHATKSICCRRKPRRASTHASTQSKHDSTQWTLPPTCRQLTRSKPKSPPIRATSRPASTSQALALIAHCKYAGALENLLAIVQRDRTFRDDIGRKTMLSVFDLAVHQPELVSQWPRKLSASLF